MKKEVKKDTIKWKDILNLRLGKINIVKMTTSPKANYKSIQSHQNIYNILNRNKKTS